MKGSRDMSAWLRNYDRLRTNPGEPNEAWTSTKFDIYGMPWDELRQQFIPELGMNFGKSCEALRKSWYHYKLLKRQGTYAGDIAYRINMIQNALERTEFDDIHPEWVDEELTSESEQLTPEEIELRREEMLEENGGDKEDDWEDL